MAWRTPSIREIMARRNAAVRRKLQEEERYRKQVKRDYEKRMKALEREALREQRAREKAKREAQRKIEAAEKLARLEARIEAKLRRQYGLPKDGELVVVVEATNRLLEIGE